MTESVTGAKIKQQILEYLAVSESKKVLKKCIPTTMAVCQKNTGANQKTLQWLKLKLVVQENTVLLD